MRTLAYATLSALRLTRCPLARRRLSKQKGQAAEIISGLVPRWKNLLNSFVETSVFLIKSMLIL